MEETQKVPPASKREEMRRALVKQAVGGRTAILYPELSRLAICQPKEERKYFREELLRTTGVKGGVHTHP